MSKLSLASVLFLAWGLLSPALAETRAGPPAGVPFDLQGHIDREVKAGKKLIKIPPGRYRVSPRKREHLRLVNLDTVDIIVEGVEMICTETTRAITIRNCRKLTLRGLAIDYDPLPFTQGRIVKISPDGLVHDIELFAGYPTAGEITSEKYEIFNPDTRSLRFGSYYGCKVTQTAPGKLRVVKRDNYRKKHPERVGDIIAIGCSNAPGGSMPHAVFIEKSSQVKLEGIKLYASNCFGFLESDCRGTVYRRCSVDRRPGATDIRKRANPRIRSLNADAFHSKRAHVGPSYIECRAAFQGDDAVAINGDYHMVMSAKGKELRVLAKHALNIAKGDPVELVSYRGRRLPDAKAVSVEPDGSITDGEKVFIRKQRLNSRLKNNQRGMLTKAFRITLDRPVTLPMGSVICSSNRIGNGFKVIDCKFGFNRSRGIIVKASKGEIRGNLLDGCWMQAIKLAPEYYWLEAGSGVDVVIRDNVIKNCLHGGINVSSSGGRGQTAPAGAHKNITIADNHIENSPAPQILVTSTDRLAVKNNTIRHRGKHVLKLKQAIELTNCKNADVRGNRIANVEQGAEGDAVNRAP